jgi:transcriptional regulator with XRE-family HTH domain
MQEGTPESIRQQLAVTLRTLRERADLSQSGLAAEMSKRGHHWHQQTVGKTEDGERKIEAAELADLAAILGVPIPRFFWKPAEARAADWLDMAANRLRGAYEDTVRAVVVQKSAGKLAERAIEDTARHDEPLVLEARDVMQGVIDRYGSVDTAVEEGKRAHRDRHDDGGEEDGEAATAVP